MFKKLYSACWPDDCHPFNALCADTDVARDAEDLKERDSALIIWGGADINPAYYNRPMHSTTHPGGMRDRMEWTLLHRAIEMQIAIIGVCRGAQMGCAAAGGWLVQNVRGHAAYGHHKVTTKDGTSIDVNSIHHQMMVPDGVDHELVAWSTENISQRLAGEQAYGIGGGTIERPVDEFWTPPEGWREPEFIYFPKIRCYAIQWHPEGMNEKSPATQYILNYIKETEAKRGSRNLLNCNC